MLNHGLKIAWSLLSCPMAVVVISLPLAGCQPKNSATVPVRGKVFLNGQPLKTGGVITSFEGGRGAQGVIRDGEFELGTFASDDGALPGIHKVGVIANDVGAASGPESMPAKSLIPARYNNPATSELTIEITPGDNNVELLLTNP
jgi:hypothetical protein